MTNINITIRGLPFRTRDAGWDESKHKRDHGKFSSSGGASSHSEAAKHHASKVAEHQSAAEKARASGDKKGAARHEAAVAAHKSAAFHHGEAEKYKNNPASEAFSKHAHSKSKSALQASTRANGDAPGATKSSSKSTTSNATQKMRWGGLSSEDNSDRHGRGTSEKTKKADIKLNSAQQEALGGSHAEVHHTGSGDTARTHVLVKGSGQSGDFVSTRGHHDPKQAIEHLHKTVKKMDG